MKIKYIYNTIIYKKFDITFGVLGVLGVPKHVTTCNTCFFLGTLLGTPILGSVPESNKGGYK